MSLHNNRVEHILNAISMTLLLAYFVLSQTSMVSGAAYWTSGWLLIACAVLATGSGLLVAGINRLAGSFMFFGGLMGFPLGMASIIAGLRLLRSKPKAVPSESPVSCKHCGYNMQGLTLPRCPECGCLPGFDVPLEALGLTEEDLNSGAR